MFFKLLFILRLMVAQAAIIHEIQSIPHTSQSNEEILSFHEKNISSQHGDPHVIVENSQSDAIDPIESGMQSKVDESYFTGLKLNSYTTDTALEQVHAEYAKIDGKHSPNQNTKEVVHEAGQIEAPSKPETANADTASSVNRLPGSTVRSDHLSVTNGIRTNGLSAGKARRRIRRAVTALKDHLWPSGIVPYEIESQFLPNSREIFLNAMRTWESLTCLTFVEREPHHQSYIIFTITTCGCCSSVGRQSPIQPQNISIAPHCESKGTVLHEIAHALGFWHEQSRPDRENYVNVAFSNVLRANQYNFYKKPAHEVDSLGEPYDYDSIMHYHNFALAKDESKETITPIQCCPRPIIGQRVKPSVGDVTQMNKLYKCPSCGQTLVQVTGSFSYPPLDALHSNADNNMQLERHTHSGISPPNALKLQSEGQILSTASSKSNAISCRWRVLGHRGERILFNFTRMSLLSPATGGDCSEEYVEVRDGYNSTSPLIGRYCGSNLPTTKMTRTGSMFIEYARSAGQPASGFSFFYRVVCGARMKGDEGKISSLGYPGNYPANRTCFWRITVPVGFFVLFTFEAFNIESGNTCQFDYVKVYDGIINNSPMLKKLCGAKLPTPILSTGNTMGVLFVSNDRIQKIGFSAKYQKVLPDEVGHCSNTNNGCEHTCVILPKGYRCECPHGYYLLPDGKSCQSFSCGDHLRTGTGSITSPEFQKEYPPNSKCVWSISAPAGYFVFLRIKFFGSMTSTVVTPQSPQPLQLGNAENCANNYVEIFDGPSVSSSLMSKLCGADLTQTVKATKNAMTVRFISDNGINHRGFEATYGFLLKKERRTILEHRL